MITIDPVERVLKFPYVCLDSLGFCHAICCRQWHVGLLSSEFQSGKYKAESYCACDQKVCVGKVTNCFQRQYRLQKKEDKSCIYLGDDCKCAIYEDRPNVCRAFSCESGWNLSSVASLPNVDKLSTDAPINPYANELHHKVILMHNPLIGLKTLFYSAKLQEIVLITKPVAKCRAMTVTVKIDIGELTDEQIQGCYSLFDGTTEMENIQAESFKLGISQKAVSQLAMKFMEVNLLVPVIH